jgi:hypothetical protein
MTLASIAVLPGRRKLYPGIHTGQSGALWPEVKEVIWKLPEGVVQHGHRLGRPLHTAAEYPFPCLSHALVRKQSQHMPKNPSGCMAMCDPELQVWQHGFEHLPPRRG